MDEIGCIHTNKKQRKASLSAAHFCCQFLHLIFDLIVTEHNELSASTWNVSKNVLF